MKYAFRNLGTMTDDKFLKVWKYLERVIQVLQNHSCYHTQQAESFAQFCPKLVRSDYDISSLL
jgi:hypothetical protein